MIRPVILSGGAGTRLWPLSRATYPKQLLPLAGKESLLVETARRVAVDGFAPPLLICNAEHRFIIAQQLAEAGIEPGGIVLEPCARNTAPAIAAAALASEAPDDLLLVLPSDHRIEDVDAFHAAVLAAAPAARDGAIVTFGIPPQGCETGYGYIESGSAEEAGVRSVAAFTEKPDAATAAAWSSSGRHFWNSGMFLFRADVMLAELATLAPQVLEAVGEALTLAERDLDFTRLDAQAFAQAPAISIDYAVMEKTDRAAVLPADFGWSDLGSWTAVAEIGTADDEGNTGIGDVIFADTRGSFVRADDRLVALLGAEDLVVVDTRDALLVATRGRVQDVRTIVAELEAAGRAEAREFPRVHRPWGNYTRIDAGRRYQVKRIVVDPGARLSLQRHRHRAEHWVVVEGRARVTCGEAVFDLEANQSTYIPLGAAHRLENPGDTPLHLIEVQSGDYLGEDDIERLEDAYGRSGPE